MTYSDFEEKLREILNSARKSGKSAITVKSGDLHRLVGGYPGKDHRMPTCCTVMRDKMKTSDKVLTEPDKGNGATLEIEYLL